MKDIVDVLVVGAGPAGLSVASALKKHNIDTIILDERKQVGDSWRSHYDSLELNSIKQLSHLPFTRFPDNYPRYPKRDQMVNYLSAYAQTHNIHPIFETKVNRIERTNNIWKVSTNDLTYQASNVVIATGLNHNPRQSNQGQLGLFEGDLLHSSEFRSGKNYTNKKVLVVGGGSSAADISMDLVGNNAKVDVSIRGPIHVTPLELLGVPAQITSKFLAKLPLSIADWLASAALSLKYGNLAKYGIQRPSEGPISQIINLSKIPLFDRGFVKLVKNNTISILPAIKTASQHTVTFANETQREYDAIILATGYTTDLAVLLPDIDSALDKHERPIKTSSNLGDGLYFIGFKDSPNGLLSEIKEEALSIAKAIHSDLQKNNEKSDQLISV